MKELPQQSKKDLEQEKLRLEIQELDCPWYQKPRWWTVIITGMAVFGTLIITYCSGIIDVSRERLENDKTLLGIEIYEFEGRRDSLLQEMANLQDSLLNIQDSLNIKVGQLLQTLDQNKQLRREKFDVEKDRQVMFDYYEAYIDSLATVISKSAAIRKAITADNTTITVDGDFLLNPKDGSILRNSDGTPLLRSKVLTDHNGVPITDHNGAYIKTK